MSWYLMRIGALNEGSFLWESMGEETGDDGGDAGIGGRIGWNLSLGEGYSIPCNGDGGVDGDVGYRSGSGGVEGFSESAISDLLIFFGNG